MAPPKISLDNILKFDHIEKPVQNHLKKVYATLAISLLLATVGAYINLILGWTSVGLLGSLLPIGLLLWLVGTPHSPANEKKRFGILLGFSLSTGFNLGPLLNLAITLNPSIVVTALMGTAVIFIAFSVSSLLSANRKWIYLGGTLMSVLMMMMLLSLANIFIGSRLMFEVQIYVGLLVFCGFVLYDTQVIIEKRRHGNDDYIWHSVDLFMDCINIFRYLLVILANKEEKQRKRRD